MSDEKLAKEARRFLDEALAVEPELEQGSRQKMRAHLLQSVAGASVVATGVAATHTSLAAGSAAASGTALAAGSVASAAGTGVAGATAAGGVTAVTALTKAVVGVVAAGLLGGGATAAWRMRRPAHVDVVAVAVPVDETARRDVGEAKARAVELAPVVEEPRSRDETSASSRDDSIHPRREARPPVKAAPIARSASTSQDSFPEELATLEKARAALAAGDWQQAMREIAENERFATARTFAEEREALRILALCAGGREMEARRLTAAFRRNFPRSLQLERIERACSKVVTDVEPGGHPR